MEPISTATVLIVANKLLGKTGDEISKDLSKIYTHGRDNIISAATRKTDINIDATVNLRVARDVFWNGSYTDETICAEYFGGVLASSRSADGKDDIGIYYLDIIKSMSSSQLTLHYSIFNCLNKTLLDDSSNKTLNLGLDKEINTIKIWFDSSELETNLKIKIDTDFEALYRKGLIHEYRTKKYTSSSKTITMVTPTTLGVHLYAVAFNKLENWRDLSITDFGNLHGIDLPTNYSRKEEDLSNC